MANLAKGSPKVKVAMHNYLVLLWAAGLHKLYHPTIQDGSTWSKFGARGEHGDVFLFSNFNRCALILRELNQIFIAYYIC